MGNPAAGISTLKRRLAIGFAAAAAALRPQRAGKTVALLLTLSAVFIVWVFLAGYYRRTAVEEIQVSLLTINDFKVYQITDWLDYHRRETVRLSRHPFLGEIVAQEMAKPGSRRLQLTEWLKDHATQKKYSGMALLTPKGSIVAATADYSSGPRKEFTDGFARAAEKLEPLLTDLYLSAAGRPRMTMFSPVLTGGRSGRPVCVLVATIDAETDFYPLLKAAPLFFTNAETLLVRREGDKVLYLNNLDFDKDAALKKSLPLSLEQLPAAAAFKGVAGYFSGTDYRKKEVISAISRVSGTGWAIITKIDRDRILGPVKTKERLLLALLLVAVLLGYIGIGALLRARERAAQDKIREGERRLAALLTNLPGVAYRCRNDRDWTMEFLSPGCLGVTGYRPEALAGNAELAFSDLIVPEDRERVWQNIQEQIAGGGTYLVSYSIKSKGGEIKTVWDQGLAVRGPDGAVTALEGYLQDITTLKQAEAGLRQSEFIFSKFMEHSPVYVFFKDKDMRSLRLSRNYEAMLGRPLGELLGKNMDELFPSDLVKSMVADDKRVLAEGKQVEVEEEFNGRTYRTIKFPIALEGKPAFLAGYTIDVTEQKKAAAALQKLQQLHTESERIGKVGGWELNIDTNKLTWTEEVYRIHEVPPGFKLDLENGVSFYTPESRPVIEAAVRHARESGEDYDVELEIVTAKGNRRAVHAIGRADLPGRRVYGFFQDITESKRAEQALAEAKALLQAAMDNSAAGIAIADAPDGKLRYVNDAGLLIRGGNRAEIVDGVGIDKYVASWKLLDLDGRPLKPEEVPLARAIMFGEAGSREFIIRRAESDDRYVLAKASPIKDGEGKITAGIVVFIDITDNKKAEEALHKSEQDNRRTLENLQVGVVAHAADSSVLWGNAEAQRVLGLTLQQLTGKKAIDPAWAFVNEKLEKLPLEEYPVNRVLSSKEPISNLVMGIRRPDRDYITWVNAGAIPVFGEGGALEKVIVNFIDFTVRREAEQGIIKANRMLALAQEASASGFWDWDMPSGRLDWTPEFYKLFGLPVDAPAAFATWEKALHPEDLKKAGENLQAAVVEHRPLYQEYRIVRPGGELAWIAASGDTLYDESGRPLRMSGLCMDITRRKETEAALAETLKLLGKTGQLAKIGGWTLDVAAMRLEWAAETRRIHEVAPDFKPSVEKAIDFYAPEDRPVIAAAVKAAIEEGKAFDLDLNVITAKGKRLIVNAVGIAEMKDGKTARVWGTFQDITVKKHLERQKEKLNAELVEKNREMENFLYITTHDLRSPLVSIQGFSRNLRDYLQELAGLLGATAQEGRLGQIVRERAPEALGFVLQSSARMDDLLSALLKVSRIGRQELKPARLEMAALIKRLLDSIYFQLREAGCEVVTGRLPDCYADQASVMQVFGNLLDNAVKYRGQERRLVIEVSGEEAGDRVRYRVSDNGPGIPEKQLAGIWNIFNKPATSKLPKGEGIGLPTARRLAERNGGTIKAESKPGEGSAFTVELPAWREQNV